MLQLLTDSTDFHLLVVGGEAEGERLERLAVALPLARRQLVRSRPLPELAYRLTGCRGFVGHDSGISHLAAALGLPCLALWGDTAQEIWAPPSEKVRVLRHAGGLARLPVAEVLEELLEMVAGS